MFVYVYKYTRASGDGGTGALNASETWENSWWHTNGDKKPGESGNIIRFEGCVYNLNEDLTLSFSHTFLHEAAPVKPRTVINKK